MAERPACPQIKQKPFSDDKTIWAQLKAIDLKEFFRKTRPTYRIMGCDLNYQDCKNDWKYQATINGHCLTYNPSSGKNLTKTFGKRPRLSMTFAQNESDATFGWNGALQGFNVHYRYPTEKLFLPGHSVYLSSKLSPMLSVQNVRQMYLGKPYTPCEKNNQSYDETECTYERLMRKLCDRCHCYPNYIEGVDYVIEELEEGSSCQPCDFFQHSVCAAKIIDEWEWRASHHCKPLCERNMFHQKSIQF